MAKYRTKRGSCGLCKPHKKGWDDKHKYKFRQKMNIADQEIKEVIEKQEKEDD